jgi:hypothetical protein
MKFGSGIQKLIRMDSQTQPGDVISLVIFLQNMKNMLKQTREVSSPSACVRVSRNNFLKALTNLNENWYTYVT